MLRITARSHLKGFSSTKKKIGGILISDHEMCTCAPAIICILGTNEIEWLKMVEFSISYLFCGFTIKAKKLFFEFWKWKIIFPLWEFSLLIGNDWLLSIYSIWNTLYETDIIQLIMHSIMQVFEWLRYNYKYIEAFNKAVCDYTFKNPLSLISLDEEPM